MIVSCHQHSKNTKNEAPYVGRYAPSPTGPLHFGSLVAGVASYLEANANNGHWLLRMDDLDQPRVLPNAADDILRTLEAFGFEWHNNVLYQSMQTSAYMAAFELLLNKQLIYPCSCTRKEIADSAVHGIDGFVYPGICRNKRIASNHYSAMRIKTKDEKIGFNDLVQGHLSHNIFQDIGDFVLQRADGYYTYQLATVVDDNLQGVTHIVRGADLLDSTSRQIFLQHQLNYPNLIYAHIPVATNIDNKKLSKQTLAPSLDLQQKSNLLWQSLQFLGQNPPNSLTNENITNIWHWAKTNWNLALIPKQLSIKSA